MSWRPPIRIHQDLGDKEASLTPALCCIDDDVNGAHTAWRIFLAVCQVKNAMVMRMKSKYVNVKTITITMTKNVGPRIRWKLWNDLSYREGYCWRISNIYWRIAINIKCFKTTRMTHSFLKNEPAITIFPIYLFHAFLLSLDCFGFQSKCEGKGR